MTILQEPPSTPEEILASRPLELPEVVQSFDEAEWYARAYRGDVPQLTLRAIALGSFLGFFLAFTNVYIGLKTGWFLGINLTATILSFAIWRALTSVGLAKTPLGILEQTCTVSTASSAGYATGNMLVASVPAMLLLSVTEANPGGVQLSVVVLVPWIFFLGALGVVLAIPMKRGMINQERLRFPSGTAAAMMLRGLHDRGREGIIKARALLGTASLSALVPLLKDLSIIRDAGEPKTRHALLPAQSNVFDGLGRLLPASLADRIFSAGPASLHPGGAPFRLSDYQIKLDHGVALVFAGILVGVRLTIWMVVSSLVLALVIAPHALDALAPNAAGVLVGAATSPGTAWKEIGLWIGAPILVAGGLVQLAAQWRSITRAFAGLIPGGRASTEVGHDVEVPRRWFLSGLLFAGSGVVVVGWLAFEIPPHLGVLAVLMTFVLATVACRTTGESDITPGSALGKLVQLAYGVLIPQSTTANLQTGAVTAGASIASADLLNDLKCGYLLGANPRRQFLAQAAGVLTGTIASVLCYFVLVPDATALTGAAGHPPTFPAPNAQLWKAVAEVLRHGIHNLHPFARVAMKWSTAFGLVLGVLESVVPARLRRWVPSATGIGLGMLLPFFYPLAMFAGALFGELATRFDRRWAERYLVPIAAGGIAGESIVGVIVQALDNFVLG